MYVLLMTISREPLNGSIQFEKVVFFCEGLGGGGGFKSIAVQSYTVV